MAEPKNESLSSSSLTSSSESVEPNTKAENLFNSIIPPSMIKYISREQDNSETNWIGWGVGFLMTIGSGGVIGYWAQKNDASASSVLLDRVVSKARQKGIVSKERVGIVPTAPTAPIERKGIVSKERPRGIVSKERKGINEATSSSTVSNSKKKVTAATTNAKHVVEGHGKKVIEGHVKVAHVAAKGDTYTNTYPFPCHLFLFYKIQKLISTSK